MVRPPQPKPIWLPRIPRYTRTPISASWFKEHAGSSGTLLLGKGTCLPRLNGFSAGAAAFNADPRQGPALIDGSLLVGLVGVGDRMAADRVEIMQIVLAFGIRHAGKEAGAASAMA